MKKIALILLIATFGLTTVSCVSTTRQQNGTAIGAGVGAGLGAILGKAIGKDTRITVEGHADSIGSEAYNQLLSQRRAQAVTDALAQRGVHPSRIQAIGFGESRVLSSDNGYNRRVDIVIQPISQAQSQAQG